MALSNKNFSSVGTRFLIWISLFYSIFMGAYFRVLPTSSLENSLLQDPDAYRHMRYVEQIVETGNMPTIDLMRHAPFGYQNGLEKRTFPWLLASSFKMLKTFFPNLTPHQFAIFYPIGMSVLTTVLFFFLAKELWGVAAALLGTPAFAVLPALISRTATGHVDTDAIILFLFLLTIYFYFRSFRGSFSQQGINKIACILVLSALGLIWQGVGVVSAIVYICDFLMIIYSRERWKLAFTSIIGILFYLGCLLIPTETYRSILNPFAFLAIVPALLAMSGHIAALLNHIEYGQRHYQARRFLRIGIVIFIALTLLLLIGFKIEVIENLLIHILYPFGKDPIMTGISELKPFELQDWWKMYGIIFPFGLIGLGFLIFEEWRTVREKLSEPKIHLICIWTSLIVMILSRTVTSFFLKHSLVVSTLFLIIPAGWAIFHTGFFMLKTGEHKSVITIMWFLTSFNLACSATRFNLFFAPILVLTSSIFLVKAFQFLIPQSRKSIGFYALLSISLIGWQLLLTDLDILTLFVQSISLSSLTLHLSPRIKLLITFIPSLILLGFLLNGFTTSAARTIHTRTKFCGVFIILFLSWLAYGPYSWGVAQKGFISGSVQTPHPEPHVQEAIEWLKHNTPSDAVVAADWDYGSAINQLGERATIIDEEHNRPTIRSFYQQVILGEKSEVVLNFLNKHRVTYLMLTVSEIYKLNGIWPAVYPDTGLDFPLAVPLTPSSYMESSYQEFSASPGFFLPYADGTNSFLQSIEVAKIRVNYFSPSGLRDVRQSPQAYPRSQANRKDEAIRDVPDKNIGIRELVYNYQQWYFPEATVPGTVWINEAYEPEGPLFRQYFSACFFAESAGTS